MKRKIMLMSFALGIICILGSCSKSYECTCYYSPGAVSWSGSVKATSATQAEKKAEQDTGDDCTCK